VPDDFLSEATHVDETEYSAFKFYTAAVDKHHHSSRVTVHTPPNLMAIINQIVQSRKIGAYKTDSDFIRDAIYHRVKFISDHHSDILSEQEKQALSREFAVLQMERDRQLADNLREAISSLAQNMDSAIGQQDYDTLKRHLLSGREIERHCGEPYRSALAFMLDQMEMRLRREE
jgi:Arc/MetJ-type ribon-helix-helix transcriptional regulator